MRLSARSHAPRAAARARLWPKIQEINMTTKSTSPDRIESARKILNAPASKIADLNGAEAVLSQVLAETKLELEGMAERRKAILASGGPSHEIEKQIEHHDESVRALTRRNEVAAAISAKLATRISADHEAERESKRQANYDETLKLHVAATNIVKEFLTRFGAEAREVMLTYVESERRTEAVNKDLASGLAPIPSIEFERKGELQPPKVTSRPFKAFVHGMRRIGEQGYVEAAPEKDGRWSVFIPGGSTSGGHYLTCDLRDFVDVVTETDATPWPENLAKSLSVPAFFVTERSGWKALDGSMDGSISFGENERALNALESQQPHHFPPRVLERVMTLAAWREMNGDVVEAGISQEADAPPSEPTQAVAAE
jgi:hypothetical protein